MGSNPTLSAISLYPLKYALDSRTEVSVRRSTVSGIKTDRYRIDQFVIGNSE